MASKELIEEIGLIVYKAKRHDSNHNCAAEEIISIILAALQDPTEKMIDASVGNLKGEHHRRISRYVWEDMLNASPLGEQSE